MSWRKRRGLGYELLEKGEGGGTLPDDRVVAHGSLAK
jgi:hypothetical protein